MAERSAAASYDPTEIRTAQPRAQTEPSQPLGSTMPPSAAPEATTKTGSTKRPQIGSCCGHAHRGDRGTKVGMKAYHPKGGGCLLRYADPKFKGTVMGKGCARKYKLDKGINHTMEDPTKFHQHWLTSKYGCQYCQLGVTHPKEYPDPQELQKLQDAPAAAAAATILQSITSDSSSA